MENPGYLLCLQYMYSAYVVLHEEGDSLLE